MKEKPIVTDDTTLAIIAAQLQGKTLETFAREAALANDERTLRALHAADRLDELGVVILPTASGTPSMHRLRAATLAALASDGASTPKGASPAKNLVDEVKPIDLEMIVAAGLGQLEAVRHFLAQGANVHARHRESMGDASKRPRTHTGTAFMNAAYGQHASTCVELYLAGADPQERNPSGGTIAHLANHVNKADLELMNAACAMGVSPLHHSDYASTQLERAGTQRRLKAALEVGIPELLIHVLETDRTLTDAEIKRSIASAERSNVSIAAVARSWVARQHAAAALDDVLVRDPSRSLTP